MRQSNTRLNRFRSKLRLLSSRVLMLAHAYSRCVFPRLAFGLPLLLLPVDQLFAGDANPVQQQTHSSLVETIGGIVGVRAGKTDMIAAIKKFKQDVQQKPSASDAVVDDLVVAIIAGPDYQRFSSEYADARLEKWKIADKNRVDPIYFQLIEEMTAVQLLQSRAANLLKVNPDKSRDYAQSAFVICALRDSDISLATMHTLVADDQLWAALALPQEKQDSLRKVVATESDKMQLRLFAYVSAAQKVDAIIDSKGPVSDQTAKDAVASLEDAFGKLNMEDQDGFDLAHQIWRLKLLVKNRGQAGQLLSVESLVQRIRASPQATRNMKSWCEQASATDGPLPTNRSVTVIEQRVK